MYIEITWYPEDSSILELELKLKQPINYIKVAMDFTVTEYIPAKVTGLPEDCYPEEGGELDVKSCMPIELTTLDAPNIPIELTKQQRIIVGNWLPYEELDEACYKAWMDNLESDFREDYDYD